MNYEEFRDKVMEARIRELQKSIKETLATPCIMCGAALTERQRLGMHNCCAPCLLATLDNREKTIMTECVDRLDNPKSGPPWWLGALVLAGACGFVWGMVRWLP